MTGFPPKATVEALRKLYKKGTRVTLLHMSDKQSPPVGTQGTVVGVDDAGNLLIHWDTGSSLSVVYGEDRCSIIN